MEKTVIETLAEVYPQLYLNPDKETIDRYKDVVLRGKTPELKDLSWFYSDGRDKADHPETPVGKVPVITFFDRRGFEQFIRCMNAAKEGPMAQIPKSMGASTLMTFNWSRIHEHQRQFMQEQLKAGNLNPDWNAEFERFTRVKDNYIDTLVALSIGPYSAVSAQSLGFSEEEWLRLSDEIRKNHELTHVICRRLYPDQINAVWDELTADAIGLYAAFGSYDTKAARLFLGIREDSYVGGRLGNYTKDPESIVSKVNFAINGIEKVIREHAGEEPFSLIQPLEERREELYKD